MPALKLIYGFRPILCERDEHRHLQQWLSRIDLLGREDFFYITHDLKDPNYLSDLGLRRSPEPKAHFQLQLRAISSTIAIDKCWADVDELDNFVNEVAMLVSVELKQRQKYSFVRLVSDLIHTNCNVLSQLLSIYVNYLGSWDDADSLTEEIFHYRHEVTNDMWGAYLLTNCGNVCASASDWRARDFYNLALSLWKDPYERFSTQMRIAVAEVKRFRDRESAAQALSKSLDDTQKLPNEQTKVFCQGLISNLTALFFLQGGDFVEAERQIEQAWTLVQSASNEELEGIHPNIANRYRLQIMENRALLACQKNQWETAIEIFNQALRFAESNHLESLQEAAALLGYALIRAGKLEEAITILLPTERALSEARLFPKATMQVQKMLAVAYSDLGDSTSAACWLEIVERTANVQGAV